jgi:CD80-like C2-set immunoglobulin domain
MSFSSFFLINKTFQFFLFSMFLSPVKPIKVKIVTPNELLTAGRPTPIRCETWGSYPPAKVIWLMDGEAIRQADITSNSEGAEANLTSSILTLRVSAENDGAELTCRSTNPWFSNGALEDKRRISVACMYLSQAFTLHHRHIFIITTISSLLRFCINFQIPPMFRFI